MAYFLVYEIWFKILVISDISVYLNYSYIVHIEVNIYEISKSSLF